MAYRIKIMSAGGRGIDAITMKESSVPRTIKRWGKNARKVYPHNSIVVQHRDRQGAWRDYRLIEDFVR